MKKLFTTTLCLAIGTFILTALARPLTPTQALSRVKAVPTATGQLRAPAEAIPSYTMTADNQNTIYIFNNPDGGFLIVSANDVANPLLGYSDTGSFDAQNIPDNIYAWLQIYSRQIVEAMADDSGTYDAQRAPRITAAPVEPIAKTQWNQNSPFNNMCPLITTSSGTQSHAVTGCVATAMAQVMKVHNWPDKGSGSNSYTFVASGHSYNQSLDFDTISYDWDKMLDTYTSAATQEQQDAVARLMLSCGVSVDMSYGVNESGAQGFNAGKALLNNFNYDQGIRYLDHAYIPADEWEQIIYDELAAGRPVLYFGQGSEGGHAFVCDGYSENGYFHFNWGWGGMSDGYYVLTALNPPALGIGGAGGGFNSDQQIIVGIQPPQEGSVPAAVMVVQGNLLPQQQCYSADQTIIFAGADGGAFIGSLSLGKITATLGFKLVDEQGNVQYIKSDIVDHTFTPMSGYGTISAFASEFPQGTFTITPAYQYNGEWQDVMQQLDSPYALQATCDGSSVNFSAMQTGPALSVTEMTQDTPFYMGDLCAFTVSISATDDYYGKVTPVLIQSGIIVGEGAGVSMSLTAGETTQYQWVTKLTGDNLTAGIYQLNFIDENVNLLCNGYQVELQEAPTDTTALSVTNIMFGSDPGTGRAADPIQLDANDIDISVTLLCTQGYWSDYVTGMFFDINTLHSVGQTEDAFVGLTADQSTTISLKGNIDGLVQGQTYYFTPWAVNNNKQLSSVYYVTIKQDTGVTEMIPEDKPAQYYNLNGEQMPDATRLSPGIYIMRQGAKAQKIIIR